MELFDSTTEEGEKRLKELKLLKSQLPAITKSNRSKRAKSGNQSEEPNQGDKQEDLVKIVDNSGNDYAVLKEASSTGRKASNKNNQISSELVLAKISELYLTRKLGLKYIKEMQPVQESFASFDSAHILIFIKSVPSPLQQKKCPCLAFIFKTLSVNLHEFLKEPTMKVLTRMSQADFLLKMICNHFLQALVAFLLILCQF